MTEIVREEFAEKTLASLSWRLNRVREKLRNLKRQSDEFYPVVMAPLGTLAILDLAIDDAANGVYPNIYKVENEVRRSANSFEELVAAVNELISNAESFVVPYEQSSEAQTNGSRRPASPPLALRAASPF